MLDVACCKYRSHSSLILRSVVVFRIYSLLDRVARFVVACRLRSRFLFSLGVQMFPRRHTTRKIKKEKDRISRRLRLVVDAANQNLQCSKRERVKRRNFCSVKGEVNEGNQSRTVK
ncbi:hypothetical protein FOIG_02131 [Fusarium odoratissimum NRRL 54006]|uniref:Uncharacterized protein n=2 Tax=Fusarium oxysporum species complex TaxID=171631 RepID=X0KKE1_FUSO5|nr:uncharacterized protein FOIG_02131 [Fusarium odoratissimum NRRL 54006]XP_031071311.1 uncharacterized protein FOIG_02131 [Fusarium odoratissimum NRRL 54006]EXM09221.1 hypothetical protein FOIG_02131 [Fusarium odoratissimum NRRL 54006]EXM09222.1 hypothetical protein FOIG_02131 [Fusarium odoratissimum NRRL 54006]TXC06430.1 hypothetical protein FocTR4_00010012 [Fusarium oxysporum f. sp. cubense]